MDVSGKNSTEMGEDFHFGMPKEKKLELITKKEKFVALDNDKGPKKEKVVVDSLVDMDFNYDPYTGSLNDTEAYQLKNEKKKTKGKKTKEGKHLRNKSKAKQASVIFPVGRIHTRLKDKVPSKCRVGGTAAIYTAAVVEYLVAELCELSGNRAKTARGMPTGNEQRKPETENGKKQKARITPQYLNFAIKEDKEFAELCKRVTLSCGGVLPKSTRELEMMYPDKDQKLQGLQKIHVDNAEDDAGAKDGSAAYVDADEDEAAVSDKLFAQRAASSSVAPIPSTSAAASSSSSGLAAASKSSKAVEKLSQSAKSGKRQYKDVSADSEGVGAE